MLGVGQQPVEPTFPDQIDHRPALLLSKVFASSRWSPGTVATELEAGSLQVGHGKFFADPFPAKPVGCSPHDYPILLLSRRRLAPLYARLLLRLGNQLI